MNSEQVNQIIPESWLWTDLDNISVLVTGKTPSTIVDEYWNGSIPFVTPSQIKASGTMLPSQRNLTILGSEKARIIPENSILIVCIGSVGKIGLLDKPSVINQQLNALIPIDPLIPKFLYYWSKYFLQSWVIENASATVNAAILNKSRLGKAPIPLPPLNEQRRIVSTIEQLTDRSHKARAALEDVPKLIAQFRQSVLAAAFRGDLTADWREKNPDIEPQCFSVSEDFIQEYELTELPNKWQWAQIDQIGDVKGGKRLPKGVQFVNEDTGFPYIKAGDLKNGTVTLTKIQYITEDIHKIIKRYIVAKGDVYITIVGACIGDAGNIPEELDGANLTENAAKICNLSQVNNEYLAFWLRSSLCQRIIQTKILSAAQGKLALSRIKTLPVPLTSEHEQIEIVSRIKYSLQWLHRIEIEISSAMPNLEFLDRSILAKAFRGELVPQDPNDEPAAVLLERIRAEREQTSTPKQRGKTTRKNSSKQLSINGI